MSFWNMASAENPPTRMRGFSVLFRGSGEGGEGFVASGGGGGQAGGGGKDLGEVELGGVDFGAIKGGVAVA